MTPNRPPPAAFLPLPAACGDIPLPEHRTRPARVIVQ